MMKSIVSVLLVCTLILAGCGTSTPSNLVTALNAIGDAASVAVVVTEALVATGSVSPDVAAKVSVYATGVSGAVTTSIAELNSTDTNPVKIANITAAFAKVAVPAFGSNAPAVSAAISAVQAALDIFLQQLNSPVVAAAAKAAPTASPMLVLNRADKSLLKKIGIKAEATKVAAATLVVK
jgi:hypothetical protein